MDWIALVLDVEMDWIGIGLEFWVGVGCIGMRLDCVVIELVRYVAVRCGAARCGAVLCGAVLCCAVMCNAVRCGAVLCWAVL